jgi:putative ABC transport system permease protein
VADSVEQVDGVAVVSRTSFVEGLVDTGEGEPTATFMTSLDPTNLEQVVDLTFTEGSLADLADDSVVVDSTTAEGEGLSVGDSVDLTFATGKGTFELVAIYEPAGFFSGYAVTNGGLESVGLQIGDTFLYVKADEGADLETVRSGLDEAVAAFPGVVVQSQAELKEQIQSSVNQVLAVIVALLGLAVIIAIMGIVNTLYLSVLERTREIGMLRAVGTSRRQVRGMIVLESMVIALFGAVLGVALGVGFATALQRTVADLGINVLTIPWVSLALYLVIALVVGALAALWPARRAARLDVLRAVTTE